MKVSFHDVSNKKSLVILEVNISSEILKFKAPEVLEECRGCIQCMHAPANGFPTKRHSFSSLANNNFLICLCLTPNLVSNMKAETSAASENDETP